MRRKGLLVARGSVARSGGRLFGLGTEMRSLTFTVERREYMFQGFIKYVFMSMCAKLRWICGLVNKCSRQTTLRKQILYE
jgi:hypothetical protein